jgi:hypothetical protein
MKLNNITLISVCGDERFIDNIIKAANLCNKHFNFYATKILSNIPIKCNYDIVEIPKLDKLQYSQFMMYELRKYVDTEFCLTFQGDGFIINSDLWTDEFLKYDYIGAPWLNEKYNNVGNGGFSLRSQKFLQSAETLEYNSSIQFQSHIPAGQLITPEDWFVCNYSYAQMKNMGVKFADIHTAYRFSVEHPSYAKLYDRHDLSSYKSFGFHGDFNVAAMKLLEKNK